MANDYLTEDYINHEADTIPYLGIVMVPDLIFEITIDNSKELSTEVWKNVF